MMKIRNLLLVFLTSLALAYSTSSAAIEMNAGFNDAWYNPATSGQGFFITVFPDIGYVSLAWFTYDTELPPVDATSNLGDPGNRWLTALGKIQGDHALMNIEFASGGIFDTPTEITRTNPPGSDGTLLLTFTDCATGTVQYDITSINKQGIVPIQRVANDNFVFCNTLAGNDPYDIAGSWLFSFTIDPADQVSGTACAGDELSSEELDTITYDPDSGYAVTTPLYSGPATVSAGTFSYSGTYDEEEGQTQRNLVMNILSPTQMAGDETWTWTADGQVPCANIHSTVTASRQ